METEATKKLLGFHVSNDKILEFLEIKFAQFKVGNVYKCVKFLSGPSEPLHLVFRLFRFFVVGKQSFSSSHNMLIFDSHLPYFFMSRSQK